MDKEGYFREVTDFTCGGKCSGWQTLFTDILPLTKEEKNRIHKYMKQHGIKEQRHNFSSKKYDLPCPFRDEANRKCLIYEVIPNICKGFMCNYTKDSLKNAPISRVKREIVLMRHEFFGSREDTDGIKMIGDLLKVMVGT
ncbi:MAG: YkgJ family cysteine cluster protein [Clostridia bacterium]|nr:YkgJ family cysteine cluster protein [Clostridia bacterium]